MLDVEVLKIEVKSPDPDLSKAPLYWSLFEKIKGRKNTKCRTKLACNFLYAQAYST